MNAEGRVGARRALVVSDSPIARDPRVLRQISWLSEQGWRVDTLGRGPAPDSLNGSHTAIPRRGALTRAVGYLFLPSALTYRLLTESTIPEPLRSGNVAARYDLVLLNEIELLPWFDTVSAGLVEAGGTAHLDLHEYAPSQRNGIAYRLVFKRFRDWMTAYLGSPSIRTRSTVARGIAKLYRDNFAIDEPRIVRSCPDFIDQKPSALLPDRIRLVHHGVASGTRSLNLLIEAMATLDSRFTLDLMLMGSEEALAPLKQQAEPFGSRITFRQPVAVHDIANAINRYDMELIFFPPINENLRFALPNKFFEAVQGRLAIVTGQSPEMAALVTEYSNGVVVDGWTADALANSLNAVTAESLAAMKSASDVAARELCSEREGAHFFEALEVTEH